MLARVALMTDADRPCDRIAGVVEHALRVQRVPLVTRWRAGATLAAWLVVCLLVPMGLIATLVPAAAQSPTPTVVVAEYDGVIHPITAEFVEDVIARADRAGAVAVILVLRTPGGLLDSTRTIISRIVASRAPVVVFIAPPGARAASAGFLITLAADVAVMAPGTHIGAAHPVSSDGRIAGRRGDVAEDRRRRRGLRADHRRGAASATPHWPRKRSPRAAPSPMAKR